MTKTCGKCGQNKSLDEFWKKGDIYQSDCIPCKKKYFQDWYANNKQRQMVNVKRRRKEMQQWMRDYKQGLSCLDCGANHPAVIEFHHVNGKDFTLATWASNIASKARFIEEVAKCVVLCANCHRIRHWKQNTGRRPI